MMFRYSTQPLLEQSAPLVLFEGLGPIFSRIAAVPQLSLSQAAAQPLITVPIRPMSSGLIGQFIRFSVTGSSQDHAQ
jgi:hypothetical protein